VGLGEQPPALAQDFSLRLPPACRPLLCPSGVFSRTGNPYNPKIDPILIHTRQNPVKMLEHIHFPLIGNAPLWHAQRYVVVIHTTNHTDACFPPVLIRRRHVAAFQVLRFRTPYGVRSFARKIAHSQVGCVFRLVAASRTEQRAERTGVSIDDVSCGAGYGAP
jgi:hypothetical protein